MVIVVCGDGTVGQRLRSLITNVTMTFKQLATMTFKQLATMTIEQLATFTPCAHSVESPMQLNEEVSVGIITH